MLAEVISSGHSGFASSSLVIANCAGKYCCDLLLAEQSFPVYIVAFKAEVVRLLTTDALHRRLVFSADLAGAGVFHRVDDQLTYVICHS